MSTNYETILNALRTDFDTNIATGLSLPTHYENFPFTVPAASIWAQWFVKFGEEDQVEFGTTKRIRTVGRMYVNLFTVPETGDAPSIPKVDAIADRYRATSALAGVVFRTPAVSKGGIEADWFKTSVECPFYLDRLV